MWFVNFVSNKCPWLIYEQRSQPGSETRNQNFKSVKSGFANWWSSPVSFFKRTRAIICLSIIPYQTKHVFPFTVLKVLSLKRALQYCLCSLFENTPLASKLRPFLRYLNLKRFEMNDSMKSLLKSSKIDLQKRFSVHVFTCFY